MNLNNALNSRALNTYGSAINDSMIYNRLISLIEQYNRLASAKGLPLKKVPVYTNHINEILITRAINAIINDIDKLRSIGDRDDSGDDGPPIRYGDYDDVFPDVSNSFVINSWKYTVRAEGGETFLQVSINDTAISEFPEDLPFNVITDNQDNTLNVTDISNMFYMCNALTSIDLNGFNTSNVTDMSEMFGSCGRLTSIDLSSFDTSSVTDMSNMFCSCTRLESIDLSSFDTSNVTDMTTMFAYCSELESIDLSSFDTSNVTDMNGMFGSCWRLASITLYKKASKILTAFPGNITDWNVNDVPLTGTTWDDDSWKNGPVTFTRTI